MFTGRGSVLGIAGKALRGASILVLAVVAGLSAFAVAGAAQPLDQASMERGSGCDAFPWSVDHERKWFADAKLRHSNSGVRLSRIDRAVDLKLVPTKSVAFFLPPERTPKPNSYSGEVTFFGVPHPGISSSNDLARRLGRRV